VAEREKSLVKYDGDEVEVRIGTSAANVTTAPPLTNVESITWNEDPTVTEVPVGMGSQATEVYDKLVKYVGAITRWHDELLNQVSGTTGTLAATIGAFSPTRVPLWIQIKNKTTGRKETLNNCLGKYVTDTKSVDAFKMETFDFKFNTATETMGP
jgi:hypothetical protein